MKTIVSPWTLAMVALLTPQIVVGFGIFDVLRASRQLKDSRRDVMAPADVLVHVVLEEFDMNGDQQITFEEIGKYFVLLPYHESNPFPYEYDKGYIITLATIMDADQSGIVELDELQRAAAVFVTNCGTKLIGWIIQDLAYMKLYSDPHDRVLKAGEIAGDFLAALDTDNNGLVSKEERETLLTSYRFHWDMEAYRAMMDDGDQNNNGNLDQSEMVSVLLAEGFGTNIVSSSAADKASISGQSFQLKTKLPSQDKASSSTTEISFSMLTYASTMHVASSFVQKDSASALIKV